MPVISPEGLTGRIFSLKLTHMGLGRPLSLSTWASLMVHSWPGSWLFQVEQSERRQERTLPRWKPQSSYSLISRGIIYLICSIPFIRNKSVNPVHSLYSKGGDYTRINTMRNKSLGSSLMLPIKVLISITSPYEVFIMPYLKNTDLNSRQRNKKRNGDMRIYRGKKETRSAGMSSKPPKQYFSRRKTRSWLSNTTLVSEAILGCITGNLGGEIAVRCCLDDCG